MTRKEKIENLRNQIQIRQTEISEMEKELNTEMVTDFYARHNLTPEQHFLYDGKECIGVEYDGYVFKTFHVKKDGGISRIPSIIYHEERIKTN